MKQCRALSTWNIAKPSICIGYPMIIVIMASWGSWDARFPYTWKSKSKLRRTLVSCNSNLAVLRHCYSVYNNVQLKSDHILTRLERSRYDGIWWDGNRKDLVLDMTTLLHCKHLIIFLVGHMQKSNSHSLKSTKVSDYILIDYRTTLEDIYLDQLDWQPACTASYEPQTHLQWSTDILLQVS